MIDEDKHLNSENSKENNIDVTEIKDKAQKHSHLYNKNQNRLLRKKRINTKYGNNQSRTEYCDSTNTSHFSDFQEKIQRNNYLYNKINHKYSYLENNIYLNNPPDFSILSEMFPEFKKHVYRNKHNGGLSIKWSDKEALKELNRCLLKRDFEIDFWEIPDGFLIPTITSRLNYICWIKSLLDDLIYQEKDTKETCFNDTLEKNSIGNINNKQKRINYQRQFLNSYLEKKKNNNNTFVESILQDENFDEKVLIKGLDIGVGANCIYPLLGYGMYKWHFKGSDINYGSLEAAYSIVKNNKLEDYIKLEKQNNLNCIFYSIVKPKEIFYFSLCNPPYFDIDDDEKNDNPHTVDEYNSQEVYCQGGEKQFIINMINESIIFRNNFLLFTTLVGRKINFLYLLDFIKTIEGIKILETTEFLQGKMIRWGLSWSFYYDIEDFFENNPLLKNNQHN